MSHYWPFLDRRHHEVGSPRREESGTPSNKYVASAGTKPFEAKTAEVRGELADRIRRALGAHELVGPVTITETVGSFWISGDELTAESWDDIVIRCGDFVRKFDKDDGDTFNQLLAWLDLKAPVQN